MTTFLNKFNCFYTQWLWAGPVLPLGWVRQQAVRHQMWCPVAAPPEGCHCCLSSPPVPVSVWYGFCHHCLIFLPWWLSSVSDGRRLSLLLSMPWYPTNITYPFAYLPSLLGRWHFAFKCVKATSISLLAGLLRVDEKATAKTKNQYKAVRAGRKW